MQVVDTALAVEQTPTENSRNKPIDFNTDMMFSFISKNKAVTMLDISSDEHASRKAVGHLASF
jgi:hypothetical protein